MARTCSSTTMRELPGSGFFEMCAGEARYVAFAVYDGGGKKEICRFCVSCADEFGTDIPFQFEEGVSQIVIERIPEAAV